MLLHQGCYEITLLFHYYELDGQTPYPDGQRAAATRTERHSSSILGTLKFYQQCLQNDSHLAWRFQLAFIFRTIFSKL